MLISYRDIAIWNFTKRQKNGIFVILLKCGVFYFPLTSFYFDYIFLYVSKLNKNGKYMNWNADKIGNITS